MDSDIQNADSQLHVEFYHFKDDPYKGEPFVRIMIPGDKTSIVEQRVREDHKERFPRQWLYFRMKNEEGKTEIFGTPLRSWHENLPADLTRNQLEELQILKFQTVEQVALASDSQMQRIGMGGAGLRERARTYLQNKNRSDDATELQETKDKLADLEAKMAMLLEGQEPQKRAPGRPKKTADLVEAS